MTVGGSTSGSMNTASSTLRPKKRLRANTQPSATPTISASSVATAATLSDRTSGNQSVAAMSAFVVFMEIQRDCCTTSLEALATPPRARRPAGLRRQQPRQRADVRGRGQARGVLDGAVVLDDHHAHR